MSTIQTLSTSDTPADTLITKFNANFNALNTDKLEASDITGKQNTLVSWTNIKTINSTSLLGSGDLSIPTLTDGDKWDITLSSGATVWTIDNWAVTNAKQANMSSGYFKWRTSVGTGSPEDLTSTQATALLDNATTSLKWLLSPTDKTKIDWLTAFIWCRLEISSTQTIYADWYIAIPWNTEDYDVWWFHTSNNSYVTIPTTWYYLFTFNLNMNGSLWSVSGNYNLYIRKSSDAIWIMSCQTIAGVNASIDDWVSVCWVLKCTSWDTVTPWVHLSWTSGNNRTVQASGTFFNVSLIWI